MVVCLPDLDEAAFFFFLPATGFGGYKGRTASLCIELTFSTINLRI